MTTGRINQVYIQSNFSVQRVHSLTNKNLENYLQIYIHTRVMTIAYTFHYKWMEILIGQNNFDYDK